ncbi:hypothetical protein [Geopsychrobacter electrodiphilus]|uniref:hypothetical protein n=1 Tax=Geopsychrobacter electrodiphilus TaxID=225196 RepID=UPI0012EC0949|nr:hypothetical protein [Geopsychrobacter electrodiphilus]
MQGQREWLTVPTTLCPVEKIDDLKMYECPESLITRATWEIVDLVISCTDDTGGVRILPFPGSLLEQPTWFRQAAKMLRSERNSNWFSALRKDVAKPKGKI